MTGFSRFFRMGDADVRGFLPPTINVRVDGHGLPTMDFWNKRKELAGCPDWVR